MLANPSSQESSSTDEPHSSNHDECPSTQEDPPSQEEKNSAEASSSLPSTSASDDPVRAGKRKEPPVPKMSRRAEISNLGGELSRTISIDRLPQEAKRLNTGVAIMRNPSVYGVEDRAISMLLRPRSWQPPEDRNFLMSAEELLVLCDSVQPLLQMDSTLVHLSAPVKVFGDIHGQYTDLMRIFDQFGSPQREGDIQLVDYLFLGDFVDRGKHSLETVVLLLSLKVLAYSSPTAYVCFYQHCWHALMNTAAAFVPPSSTFLLTLAHAGKVSLSCVSRARKSRITRGQRARWIPA